MGNFHFFGRGKTNFGGVQLQNWLASDHPGAYTSMPHPFFGAKDVCYIQKRWPNKNLFLGRPACIFFFLGGVLDFYHLFCCWCHVAFPFSHVVVSFVSFAFACCLVLLYMILVSHTVVSARVSFTTSSVSVLQIRSIAVAF